MIKRREWFNRGGCLCVAHYQHWVSFSDLYNSLASLSFKWSFICWQSKPKAATGCVWNSCGISVWNFHIWFKSYYWFYQLLLEAERLLWGKNVENWLRQPVYVKIFWKWFTHLEKMLKCLNFEWSIKAVVRKNDRNQQ